MARSERRRRKFLNRLTLDSVFGEKRRLRKGSIRTRRWLAPSVPRASLAVNRAVDAIDPLLRGAASVGGALVSAAEKGLGAAEKAVPALRTFNDGLFRAGFRVVHAAENAGEPVLEPVMVQPQAEFTRTWLKKSKVVSPKIGWVTLNVRYRRPGVDGEPVGRKRRGKVKIRYLRGGRRGRGTILLLHGDRTLADVWWKVLPAMSETHEVYAFDALGSGYSTILDAVNTTGLQADVIEQFLEKMDLRDVTLVGEASGATQALVAASRGNQRIARVVAFNPYDSASSLDGLNAGSNMANMLDKAVLPVPVLNLIGVHMERWFMVYNNFAGALDDDRYLLPVMDVITRTGFRHKFRRSELSQMTATASYLAASKKYRRIRVPVILYYGKKDWSSGKVRARNRRRLVDDNVPGSTYIEAEGVIHLMSLGYPEEVRTVLRDHVPVRTGDDEAAA